VKVKMKVREKQVETTAPTLPAERLSGGAVPPRRLARVKPAGATAFERFRAALWATPKRAALCLPPRLMRARA